MSNFVCRVCLCSAVRMHSIEDHNLVEIYETMSGSKLNTEDRRPTTICYICVSQLRRCHKFFIQAHKTEGILTYLQQNGIEVPHNDVNVLALAASHDLTVTSLPHFEVGEYSGTMSCKLKVEEDQVVVKEEQAEGKDLIDIEESRLPDIKEGALDVAMDNCHDTEQHESNSFSESKLPKPYVCHTCNKAFTLGDDFLRHILIHTEEKLYVCNTCNKAFDVPSSFKRHLLVHTGEKPFVCHTCNKAFNQAGNLRQHMMLHTGRKPHACDTCNKTFAQVIHLRRHMLIHTGEKPYVCHICNKAFSLGYKFRRHMLTHTGEKPHVCHTCNKAFNLAENLRRHILIHTT